MRLLNEVEPAQLRTFTDGVSGLIDDRLPMMFDTDDDWPRSSRVPRPRGELMEAVTALVERDHGDEAQMLLRI